MDEEIDQATAVDANPHQGGDPNGENVVVKIGLVGDAQVWNPVVSSSM